MEPEAEDLENKDNPEPWSGSEGSQDLGASGSLAESYNEEDVSEAEYPLEPPAAHVSIPPERHRHEPWEAAGEQPDFSGSEGEGSYQEDDVYLSDSRESFAESPDIHPSQSQQSPPRERPDLEPLEGQTSRPHSQSSSSALGCATEMTLALTLTAEEPQGASNRQGPGTANRRVESSEEGGSSEAPPASVFFGISNEGAEPAETRNSESDTDLCRPDRHRARNTRLTHSESQSERHVKETKSKCKRIARLLTDAPNPQNKGALLFKKRRQRVKKYTLVSYGTGENQLDSEDQIEEETEEVRAAGYNFLATSDSELEEQYSLYHQQQNVSLNWGSVREMEALPETKGKGVLMFAQRRRRMDEIVSEHEDLRSQGLPAEAFADPACAEAQNIYDAKEMYVHADEAGYMDVNLQQHVEYQERIQHGNHLANAPKPLVPNRTAKPFLGFQKRAPAPVMAASVAPATRKNDARFKVPVPINTHPQVWSPTGDVIASRDERISVPAIKTGILPESKRKSTNKQASMLARESALHLQNKGERKSFIECEEDCFSLGAEACNFMQPRSIKLKNPPPVAPKPVINPACPPWMRRSPSCEPYVPSRSPVSLPAHSPVGPHSSHYLQEDDWAQPQHMASHWAADQTPAALQTPANAWAAVSTSPQLHLQPATNSWSQQPQRSPVSMQARSPAHSPHYPPSPSRNKADSVSNSEKSFVRASKVSQGSPERGASRGSGGATLGKGAALFAKRQSRMERFVVDSESVQAGKTRSPSPTSSLPNSWRYSSNIRAPPPLSYNPLLSPFYPPSAAKQPPSTSPKPKPKEKPKAAAKHLNALDIMKHQPYQLDSSLFKYDAIPETKSPSPSPSPKPTPVSKFEVTMRRKQKSASTRSPFNTSELADQSKAGVHAGSGLGRSRSLSLPRRLNSAPGPGPVTPARRQASFQERVYKQPTPWEAASRSPIGSVEEAFVFRSLTSSVATDVRAAGQRRSLPEPPDEWKRRVSLDPAAVGGGHRRHAAAPAFQPLSTRRTFSPEKPAFYGPPFRPAQPLRPASRAHPGYMAQGSGPVQFSPLYSAVQRT